AELLTEIECSRFADARFAATGRSVKQKTFRCSMLKSREKVRMQEWQLDRVLDCLQRRFLAADFFPRQLWHGVEVVFVRFSAREHLQRHAVIGVNADFIA